MYVKFAKTLISNNIQKHTKLYLASSVLYFIFYRVTNELILTNNIDSQYFYFWLSLTYLAFNQWKLSDSHWPMGI